MSAVTSKSQDAHKHIGEKKKINIVSVWNYGSARPLPPALLSLLSSISVCHALSLSLLISFLSVCLSLFLCLFLHFNPKPTPLLFPLSPSSAHPSLPQRPFYLFARSFVHRTLRAQDEKVLEDCCRSETGGGQKEGEMGRDGR